MNERVIEAAAKAAQQEMERPGGGWNARKVAESAITAALAALAPDVKAAVERMLISFADYLNAQQYGAFERTPDSDQRIVDANRAWNRDLFALLGMPEDGA